MRVASEEEEESKGDNGATGECKGLPESKKPLINKQARKKGKRPGSKKRKKKKNLEIHAQERIRPLGIGSDWRKVAERPMIIQDIVFQARNTQYILEVWESPDKQERLCGQLPSYLQGTHFGSTLKSYVLYQYFSCRVPKHLIYEQLCDIGVDISTGTINNLLIKKKEGFHKEKADLLEVGKRYAKELRTDDTGARHLGKNGYVNCINTDYFTYFETTYSKSRINFLEILRGHLSESYRIEQVSFTYLEPYDLPQKYLRILQKSYETGIRHFKDKQAFEQWLRTHQITQTKAVRLITEACLMGTIVYQGIHPSMSIHSDGAEQFVLFIHSLCWKHAERPLVQLTALNQEDQQLIENKKMTFWQIYQQLKAYQQQPKQLKHKIEAIQQQFEQMCQPTGVFIPLDKVLKNLQKKKDQLLLALHRPHISIQNNPSERDIREFVTRRKMSGTTRSEQGRKALDTFLSLKKTSRKLGISFWKYLIDRIEHTAFIEPLANIVARKLMAKFPP